MDVPTELSGSARLPTYRRVIGVVPPFFLHLGFGLNLVWLLTGAAYLDDVRGGSVMYGAESTLLLTFPLAMYATAYARDRQTRFVALGYCITLILALFLAVLDPGNHEWDFILIRSWSDSDSLPSQLLWKAPYCIASIALYLIIGRTSFARRVLAKSELASFKIIIVCLTTAMLLLASQLKPIEALTAMLFFTATALLGGFILHSVAGMNVASPMKRYLVLVCIMGVLSSAAIALGPKFINRSRAVQVTLMPLVGPPFLLIWKILKVPGLRNLDTVWLYAVTLLLACSSAYYAIILWPLLFLRQDIRQEPTRWRFILSMIVMMAAVHVLAVVYCYATGLGKF